MHVVFDESNVLLNNCEDCVEHSMGRDVSLNEEKEEIDTKHEDPIRTFPKR